MTSKEDASDLNHFDDDVTGDRMARSPRTFEDENGNSSARWERQTDDLEADARHEDVGEDKFGANDRGNETGRRRSSVTFLDQPVQADVLADHNRNEEVGKDNIVTGDERRRNSSVTFAPPSLRDMQYRSSIRFGLNDTQFDRSSSIRMGHASLNDMPFDRNISVKVGHASLNDMQFDRNSSVRTGRPSLSDMKHRNSSVRKGRPSLRDMQYSNSSMRFLGSPSVDIHDDRNSSARMGRPRLDDKRIRQSSRFLMVPSEAAESSVDPYLALNPFLAPRPDDDEIAPEGVARAGEMSMSNLMPHIDERGQKVEVPEVDDEEKVCDHSTRDLGGKETDIPDEPPRTILGSGLESFKYIFSSLLLIFSIVIVVSLIFEKKTQADERNIPPVVAFLLIVFLIILLATMEGGQGCLVGLQPVDKELYRQSHPVTFKNTTLAHKEDNMERFIVGRQFLVVLVVFLTNMMGSAKADVTTLGLDDITTEIFIGSGVAMIVITIMLGQLTAQVNASNCMLDFINNSFMLYFVNYVSLAIEFSGLLHCVYLVQIIFAKIAGKSEPKHESSEPPRSVFQKLFFWVRVLVSLTILAFAFAITLKAIFDGKTAMWEGIPGFVSVILLFVLMSFVGLMEGMQIAMFAVINMPEEKLKQHKFAHACCELTFRDQNLQAFLIGRQICVTICMFVVARITSLDYGEDEDNVFGVPDGLQEFFNTGLLGAVITTIVASLAWRIVASSFPLAFLSNPIVYVIIRLCLLLEKSGVCSAAWVLARYHKPIMGYQPDEVHLEGAERHGADPVTRRDHDIDRVVAVVKYTYSLALLAFSVIVVMTAIFTEKTAGTKDMNIPPIVAFLIFWLLIIWLATAEGGQGDLVCLQHMNKSLYMKSHPLTYKNTTLAHKGNNMERFIVGRQFLVVLLIFVCNMMASAAKDETVLGLPNVVNEIFLGNGLGLILVTIVLGQLTAQVNAATCMLDFINNSFMLYFVNYVSLAIEFSGLLHCVYLVQIVFAKITGNPIETDEPPRNFFQKVFFWVRVQVSVAILAFAFAITIKALFDGKTAMWEGIPEFVSVIVLFVLMSFVGLMEGMQIALFAVVNMPEEELERHKFAHANCQLAFSGQNLQAFLIGRQICVSCCMFVVARITTLDYSDDDDNIYGVSDGIQEFLNTGLLGALITTIFASLAWRVIASSFPLAFLSNPLIYVIIRLCLVFEKSGICSASWVMARVQKRIMGYKPDGVHLEGVEAAATTKRDKDVEVTVTVIKYFYSMALLVFSLVVVISLVSAEDTRAASWNIPPVATLIIMVFLISWLSMMEGGQGCLVGLQTVDKDTYKDSHKITYKNTTLAHKGDNMKRFIVGRQFLVVLVVFLTNMMGAAKDDNVTALGLSDLGADIFIRSGAALILITVVLGQLTAQINAANNMRDFINNYFMLYFVNYVSLAVEFSGLLHCVYLVQMIFSKIAGRSDESSEPARNGVQKVFFWVRVLLSLAVLSFAVAVAAKGLIDGKTKMWEGVPGLVTVVILLVLFVVAGMMEGMQIAMFTVIHMHEEELKHHKMAHRNCHLAFRGANFQAFLIGRQICVTCCMFVLARIFSFGYDDEDDNIFGVPDLVQEFLNTGLVGAVVVTIMSSLAWRIVAASFPLIFMSNPLIYVILRVCLLVEESGIGSAAWLFAHIEKEIFG